VIEIVLTCNDEKIIKSFEMSGVLRYIVKFLYIQLKFMYDNKNIVRHDANELKNSLKKIMEGMEKIKEIYKEF
jgi:hypothetical protein